MRVKEIMTEPKDIENAIDSVGYENVLNIIPCPCYDGCLVVILYKEKEE